MKTQFPAPGNVNRAIGSILSIHKSRIHKSKPSPLSPSPQSPTSAGTSGDGGYDLEFVVTDEKTGSPIPDWPYTIELATGRLLEGRTDQAGKTSNIAASYAEHAILRVYAPEPARINLAWDYSDDIEEGCNNARSKAHAGIRPQARRG